VSLQTDICSAGKRKQGILSDKIIKITQEAGNQQIAKQFFSSLLDGLTPGKAQVATVISQFYVVNPP
jgi:hypothetical protein